MVGDNKYAEKQLKKRGERVCRFCKKDSHQTTFKNDAHLVSKFLGNTTMFSDFECDKCNSLFSGYETDLSYFLGVGRSFLGLKEAKKAPGLITDDVIIKSRIFKGHNILILSSKIFDNQDQVEQRRAGTVSIEYTKSSYTPLKVYKALLKSAISILPAEVAIRDYTAAISYLMSSSSCTGPMIYGYQFPFNINMPLHIQLFAKRDKNELIPTHVAGFYFKNQIIFFPLLFNIADIALSDREIEMPLAPPFFLSGNTIVEITPNFFQNDLSTSEKKDDDRETVTLKIDPTIYQSLSGYDPVNDVFYEGPYDPANTKYLIFSDDNTIFTQQEIKELSEMIIKTGPQSDLRK